MNCLDRERLPGSLELRTWQPGDQYQPVSHGAAVKIKTLFQEARVPVWDRSWWPVLAAGSTIVWTRQFGAGAEFAAGPSTHTAISVKEVAAEASKSSLPGKHLEPGIVRLLK